MTVAELLGRISSREISEWMAFSQLEPFGSAAHYYGTAIVAATVANVNRPKSRQAYDTDEFMPKFEPKIEQTMEEMLQFAQMITIGLGGADLRGQRDDK